MITAETERFILRPFVAQDIDFLDQLHSDPLVMRYILGRVRSHDENIVYLNRLLALEKEHGIGQRIVILKKTNKPVGRCGMSFFYGIQQAGLMSYHFDPAELALHQEATRVMELGYSFLRDSWGKGYATEAATAMRDHGLKVQNIPEVHSLIIQENAGSVAVAEKIGAKRMGECLCVGKIAWDYISRL